MKLSQEVKSTAIQKVTYNTDTEILSITFQQGTEYDYPGVPIKEYYNLIGAHSIGQYFNKYIRPYSVNYKH